MSETTAPRDPARRDEPAHLAARPDFADSADLHDLHDSPNASALSALFDGELDDAGIAPLSAKWGRDAGLREQWQTYSLIGDVLRTGAQASEPTHDRLLFDAIRTRLAQEPVVLTPQARAVETTASAAQVIALPVAANRRAFWRRRVVPAAGIAAGLAFVSMMVWKLPQPAESGRELASAPSVSPATVVAVSAASSNAATPEATATGTATAAAPLSDPSALPMRPYLQAHRAMTAGFAIDPGPGQLRRVAQEQVAR